MNEQQAHAQIEQDNELLVVRDLDVAYGTVSAVRGASFSIRAGERVALVGESGSGKTTLGMAVAGFVSPTASVTATTLRFRGEDLTRRPHDVLAVRTPGMAFVFQDAMTSLDPVWTVGSQLRAVIRANESIGRRAATVAAVDWLSRVGLTDTDRVMRARPHQLSGGMRQRVMLAIALSGRPALVVADEPTSALDATLSRATMELLTSLSAESGTALLVVSHDIQLCCEYSDRTLVMYQGEIVEEGASATLAERAQHPYTAGLLNCVPSLTTARRDRLPTRADFAGAATLQTPERAA
ncbi:MAG: ABC transporter ATP-binding protein [Microbacterium sp.]|uniref:ABC transporter ATP-binding protein n=1 Tax=Microbacterium sp. TaxID=51671 RepID=UPI0027229DC4|nr:ABC transporter ATP-binding protein [Microbacterium sp.]MDO8382838.1 ABC transporter ATP-binding protein [Microbacterium sp.]